MWQKAGENRKYNRTRESIGVACCRINKGKPEILLICKRYTYAYNLFVQGKYNSSHNSEIIELFNGMTIDEKLDIRSLNFMQIWYRVWLDNTPHGSNYFVSKNKFETTFLADNGARLKKLLSKSTNSDKIWEIPKGRKASKAEPDIHCAIREFREETGIHKKSYKIFLDATRTYSYIDDGVKYSNTYYIAFTKYNIEPKIDFSLVDQLDEISDIRWMDIEDIRHIDKTGRLVNFVKPIFAFIKRRI